MLLLDRFQGLLDGKPVGPAEGEEVLRLDNRIRDMLGLPPRTKMCIRDRTYAEAHELKNTDCSENYSSCYKDWLDIIAAAQAEMEERLAPVAGAVMVSHEKLDDGLTRTGYDNGWTVYVNYGAQTRTCLLYTSRWACPSSPSTSCSIIPPPSCPLTPPWTTL